MTGRRITVHLSHCKFHTKAETAAKKDPSALSGLSSTHTVNLSSANSWRHSEAEMSRGFSVSSLHQHQTAYWCNVVSSVQDTKLRNDGTSSWHSEKRVAVKCSQVRAASSWHIKETTSCSDEMQDSFSSWVEKCQLIEKSLCSVSLF